jgi:hypothetical protein
LFINTLTGGQNRRRTPISQVVAHPVKPTFSSFNGGDGAQAGESEWMMKSQGREPGRSIRPGIPGFFAVAGNIVNQSLVFLRGNRENDTRWHEKSFGHR